MPFARNLLKLKDEFALTAANGVALLIQFVFQSAILRYVSPQEFGHISSLLAIQGVLNIPIAIWQLGQARSLSSYSGSGAGFRKLALEQLKSIRAIALAGFALYLVIGPLARVYVKQTSFPIWILVVAGCLLSVVESWALACFQSRHAFIKLGLVSLGAATARLLTILFLLPALNSIVAVLVAVLSGFLVPILGIALFFRSPDTEARLPTTFLKVSLLPASLSTVFTILWLNLDVVIARNRFEDAAVAGHFAAVAVLCKAVFWFTSPISTIYLPRIVKAEVSVPGSGRRLLYRAIGICFAIGAMSIGVIWSMSGWIIHLFSGKPEDHIMAEWLRWAILAKFPIVCVTPFLAYFVVKDSKRVLFMLLALLLLTFLYAQAFAGDVPELLMILFAGGLSVFATGWIAAWYLGPRQDLDLDF